MLPPELLSKFIELSQKPDMPGPLRDAVASLLALNAEEAKAALLAASFPMAAIGQAPRELFHAIAKHFDEMQAVASEIVFQLGRAKVAFGKSADLLETL